MQAVLTLVALVATATVAALAARTLLPPAARLGRRVRPYSLDSRVSLGRAADVGAVAGADGGLLALFGVSAASLVRRAGRLVDGSSDDELQRRIDQAGLLPGVPGDRRVVQFRLYELRSAAIWAGAAGGAGGLLDLPAAAVVTMAGLGLVAGVGRWRGRLDRAVTDRRARIRIELYTVNQLLAMHVRVGGGVVQAVRHVVARGSGEVVGELREILRAHSSGVPAARALAAAARSTPEPHAARTYRLLAAGAEHGADLATALLAHSDDLRDARREDLRRAATRRRAAMLVPIVAILAPVMLLFVAAPIPQLVFGAR